MAIDIQALETIARELREYKVTTGKPHPLLENWSRRITAALIATPSKEHIDGVGWVERAETVAAELYRTREMNRALGEDLGEAMATINKLCSEDGDERSALFQHPVYSVPVPHEESSGWIPTELALPNVEPGDEGYFWVAVTRGRVPGKVYTFPAVFLNQYKLHSEHPDNASGPGWSQVRRTEEEAEDDEGDIICSGWYDIKRGVDYDREYEGVCEPGDKVIAWHRGPEYPDAKKSTSYTGPL